MAAAYLFCPEEEQSPHCRCWRVPMAFEGSRPLLDHDVDKAGLIECQAPWTCAPLVLGHHLLLYTSESRLEAKVHTSLVALETNSLWLLPRGLTVSFSARNQPRWRGMGFWMRDAERWAHLRGEIPRPIFAGQGLRIVHCLEGLISEAYGPQPDKEAMAGHFAAAAAIYLDRRLHFSPDKAPFIQRFHDLWDAVRAALGHPWTVREMAEAVHVSPPHFYRLCREFHCASPGRCLLRMRMEVVRQLLAETNLTLDAIASQTGYESGLSLSKAFRKYFKIAPRTFRQDCFAKRQQLK